MKSIKYLILFMLCLNLGCKQNLDKLSPVEKLSVLTTFPKKQYLEDLDQLILLLTENHPQVNEYISKAELKNLVVEKKALIHDDFKIGEFIWLCRSILSEIGCGHTVVPTLGLNYFLPDSRLFPVEVNFLNNKLYVVDPLKNKNLISSGDEILTINGRKVQEVIGALFDHVSSDADNRSFKTSMINDGFMEYAAFYFGFVNRYEIVMKKGGEIKTIQLNQLSTYQEKSRHEKCENNLCFEVDQQNDLAIITIRSFYYYRENFPTFKTFIDSCFAEIKAEQIQNLVIDLRDNGGGAPYCGSYLLQYIADTPYQYYKTGTYGYTDLQQPIAPHKDRFLRTPYILINGRCFSTTGQFCALVKANDYGVFVGKETGATYRCNATAKPFELTNTAVTPYIATRTFEANVSTLPKDKGIVPDHETYYDIYDLLNDKDVDLEFCLKLINNK